MLKKLFILLLILNSSSVFSSFLIETDWLTKNLNSSAIRLIDMSENTQYQRFHIPGAIHLPYSVLNKYNKKGVSISIGKKNIIKLLGLLGINNNHHIVIYDDMGGLHASRLFWELEKIGHKKISLLNGGLVKWILQGNKVIAKATPLKTTQYKTGTNVARDNTVSYAQIKESSFSKDNTLLDVRSKDEYVGQIRYPRSGHIPGARWLEWQEAVDFENAFTMKKRSALKHQLKNIGITNNKTPVTLYCRSGHRAAHSYFILRNLGYDKVRLYDASMAEYYKIKSAPLIRGTKP